MRQEATTHIPHGFLFLAAVLLLAASVATTASARTDQKSAAQDDDELAKGGKQTTEMVCTQCHGLEDVTARRRNQSEWNDVIQTMVANGANATDEQFALVKRYLTRYYGLVAVNTAPAEELSAVLGLSAKDASAIVEYRNAHGKFADAAAVASVPNIDKAKIEAQADALVFE